MDNYIETLIKEREADDSFKYMLLSRMQSDCNFYLGDTPQSFNEKYLWAGNVEEHIQNMKDLWNSFKEKPEWLSMEQIEAYERKMRKSI